MEALTALGHQVEDSAPVRLAIGTPRVDIMEDDDEAAQLAGVEHIVSVFDAQMARIFRTVNCPYEVDPAARLALETVPEPMIVPAFNRHVRAA